MRIWTVYGERQSAIALRRAACVARIARQREQIAAEFQRLESPLRALDIALQVGAGLREHGAAITMIGLPLLLILGRRLASGAGAVVRLARNATRWWSVWKLGSALLSARRRKRGVDR